MLGLNPIGTILFCLFLVYCFFSGMLLGGQSIGIFIALVIFNGIMGGLLGAFLGRYFSDDS